MITSAVDIRRAGGMIDVSRLGARGYDDFVRTETRITRESCGSNRGIMIMRVIFAWCGLS